MAYGVPGPGIKPSCHLYSWDLHCGNSGCLIHCARLGPETAPQVFRDSDNPIVPHQDHSHSSFDRPSPPYFHIQIFMSMLFFCLFFFFLGLHPQHMEVPRLEVKLELQLPASATATPDPSHICDLHHSLQQHWILNLLREPRDRTLRPHDS